MNPPVNNAGTLTRSFLHGLVGRALPLVLALGSLPFLVNGLGTERFAILSLVWVILGHFGMFDFGLGRAATHFVSAAVGRRDEPRVTEVLWTCCAVQALLGSLGALAIWSFSSTLVTRILNVPIELQADASKCFALIALSLPLVLVETSLRGGLEAYQRFDLVNWVRVPASCVSILIPLACAQLGHSLPTIVALLVCARALSLAANFCLLQSLIPSLNLRPRFNAKILPGIASFSGWVSVTNMCGPLLGYTERFLIGSLLSLSSLTYYVVPMDALSRLLVLPSSLSNALFPALSSRANTGDTKPAQLLTKPIKLLCIAMLPIVAIGPLVSGDVLSFFLGREFALASNGCAQILIWVVFLNALACIPFSVVQGLGRPKFKARLDVIELPIFLALGYFLVGDFGLVGAAYAKLAITVIDLTALVAYSGRLVKLPMAAFLRRALVPVALPGAGLFLACLGINQLSIGALPQLLVFAALTICYAAAAFKVSLTPHEQAFLHLRLGKTPVTSRQVA